MGHALACTPIHGRNIGQIWQIQPDGALVETDSSPLPIPVSGDVHALAAQSYNRYRGVGYLAIPATTHSSYPAGSNGEFASRAIGFGDTCF